MVNVLHIVGTRPQIIKAAALSRQINTNFADRISEILVDTGQHYDKELSSVFYEELMIPKPNINLEVGSGSHGEQTAAIITGVEKVITTGNPSCVVVYGDTNSTLASALAAAKLGFPVVHIESGLRSFTKNMPEEINRVVCDHLSTLLFSPTEASLNNLKREGLNPDNSPPYTLDNPGIFHCGDVMFDNCIFFGELVQHRTDILQKFNLNMNQFLLVTIHREMNTDHVDRLESIFEGLLSIVKKEEFSMILPLHPRTAKAVDGNMNQSLLREVKKNISLVPPVSYLEMITLEKHARLIITDSGGVQKESHFFQKPCIVLRPETEWVELVENKTAILADADPDMIEKAYNRLISRDDLSFPEFYGDGRSAEFICEEIIANFQV